MPYTLTVYYPDEEYLPLKKLADDKQVKITALVRELCKEAMYRRGVKPE